jgi:hypothetical protein
MWLLAIAVALLGSSALHAAGIVDLSKSIYPGPSFTWLSYLVGGFLFGVGMTLGSGCGSKTLIRVGAGNLKSLVVYIFLGIAAYMTLRVLFGAFRVGVLEKASITLAQGQDLPALLGVNRALLAALIGGALIVFAYSSRQFRASFDYTLGGVVTGLVVVGGWYVSGHVGRIAEDPNTLQEAFVATNSGRMESFSFVAPFAYTLEYLMLWTDKSKIITYGIASAAGVVAGSAAYAAATRSFRWEGFRDAEDTANHIVGGILMAWRHHGARLHHRPGDHLHLHARARLDHDLRRDRGRLRGDDEVPGLANRAPGLIKFGPFRYGRRFAQRIGTDRAVSCTGR